MSIMPYIKLKRYQAITILQEREGERDKITEGWGGAAGGRRHSWCKDEEELVHLDAALSLFIHACLGLKT